MDTTINALEWKQEIQENQFFGAYCWTGQGLPMLAEHLLLGGSLDVYIWGGMQMHEWGVYIQPKSKSSNLEDYMLSLNIDQSKHLKKRKIS